MIYPWLQQQWQQSINYVTNQRLAHANLISGPSAIGKLEFCLALMQRMNCSRPTIESYACNSCQNCKLFQARTHPDVRLINVDEVHEQIKVDDIRDINSFITLSRQHGSYKLVCINLADHMNVNAANALLKTLEEPPEGTYLFLISHRPDRLLATIKSRCQLWKFYTPDENLSLQWLHEQSKKADWNTLLSVARGRPLFALQLNETGLGRDRLSYYQDLGLFMQYKEKVTKLSAKLQNEELEKLVTWQQAWCADLIRCHYIKEPVTLENLDIRRTLHSLVGRVDLQLLFQYMDKLIELHRFSKAPLNKRLFIEDMLIRCQETLVQPT